MLALMTIKSTLIDDCKILDKATYRHRTTLGYYLSLLYVIVIVNHCPNSYIRRIVSNLVLFTCRRLQTGSRKLVFLINLSIRERFRTPLNIIYKKVNSSKNIFSPLILVSIINSKSPFDLS